MKVAQCGEVCAWRIGWLIEFGKSALAGRLITRLFGQNHSSVF
jgi:hypothetical protein